MKQKLTALTVEKAQATGREYVIWDTICPGLGLRVHPSGAKAYILGYRHHGRYRRLKLGLPGHITLDQARRLGREKLGMLAEGVDPAAAAVEAAQPRTVADLAHDYMEHHAIPNNKPSSVRENRYKLDRFVLPLWGHLPVDGLRRIDVLKQHRAMAGTPYQANRLLALVSKMYELAERWGHVPPGFPNPARKIEKYKERRRDDWIRPDDLPRLMAAVEAEPSVYVRAAVLLYLLTGLRNRELMARRWDDIEVMVVRGERRATMLLADTKAGRPFRLPLSAAALEVIEGIPRQGENPWIFPSTRKPGEHMSQFPRQAWDRIRGRAGMPDLKIHSLRHTFASWAAAGGASMRIIAGALNQSTESVTEGYAHLADDPIRQVLEEQGGRVLDITKVRRDAAGG